MTHIESRCTGGTDGSAAVYGKYGFLIRFWPRQSQRVKKRNRRNSSERMIDAIDLSKETQPDGGGAAKRKIIGDHNLFAGRAGKDPAEKSALGCVGGGRVVAENLSGVS